MPKSFERFHYRLSNCTEIVTNGFDSMIVRSDFSDLYILIWNIPYGLVFEHVYRVHYAPFREFSGLEPEQEFWWKRHPCVGHWSRCKYSPLAPGRMKWTPRHFHWLAEDQPINNTEMGICCESCLKFACAKTKVFVDPQLNRNASTARKTKMCEVTFPYICFTFNHWFRCKVASDIHSSVTASYRPSKANTHGVVCAIVWGLSSIIMLGFLAVYIYRRHLRHHRWSKPSESSGVGWNASASTERGNEAKQKKKKKAIGTAFKPMINYVPFYNFIRMSEWTSFVAIPDGLKSVFYFSIKFNLFWNPGTVGWVHSCNVMHALSCRTLVSIKFEHRRNSRISHTIRVCPFRFTGLKQYKRDPVLQIQSEEPQGRSRAVRTGSSWLARRETNTENNWYNLSRAFQQSKIHERRDSSKLNLDTALWKWGEGETLPTSRCRILCDLIVKTPLWWNRYDTNVPSWFRSSCTIFLFNHEFAPAYVVWFLLTNQLNRIASVWRISK